MDTQSKKNTAAEIAAANEGIIVPEQLLVEIKPLLEEYFIGDFEMKDGTLIMSFRNGQTFKLSAEVVSNVKA